MQRERRYVLMAYIVTAYTGRHPTRASLRPGTTLGSSKAKTKGLLILAEACDLWLVGELFDFVVVWLHF